MKKYVGLLALCLVGCLPPSYSSHPTKIGPDRFVITAHSRDPYSADNYTKMLQEAYETCVSAGYQDYMVYNTARDDRKSIIYVKCGANSPDKPEDGNSMMADLERWYESAKKKIAEKINAK